MKFTMNMKQMVRLKYNKSMKEKTKKKLKVYFSMSILSN